MVHGLKSLCGMWDVPGQGMETVCLRWQVDSLPLSPQGSPTVDFSSFVHLLEMFDLFLINLAVPGLSSGMRYLQPSLWHMGSSAMGIYSMWDLVHRPEVEPGPPALGLGVQSLGQWATREVTGDSFKNSSATNDPVQEKPHIPATANPFRLRARMS